MRDDFSHDPGLGSEGSRLGPNLPPLGSVGQASDCLSSKFKQIILALLNFIRVHGVGRLLRIHGAFPTSGVRLRREI